MIHKILVKVFACISILIFGFSAFAQQNEMFVQKQLQKIASNDKDSIKAAADTLTKAKLPATFPFLKAINYSSLYKYDALDKNAGLVIAEAGAENTEKLKLFHVYPDKAPVKNSQGRQMLVAEEELVLIEAGRPVRMIINKIMPYINLKADDLSTRKMAIQQVGQQGAPADTVIFSKIIANTKNEQVKRIAREGYYALKLKSDAPEARKSAVAGLKENKGAASLGILENHLEKETDSEVKKQVKKTIGYFKARKETIGMVQNLFTGISKGSVLIMIALGLAVIYGLMGVINMAHGEFMMIGAYTTFVIQNLFLAYLPPAYIDYFFLISLPLSFLVAGCIGLLIESLLVKYLYFRPLDSLLATWGVSLMLIQACRGYFGDVTSVKSPDLLGGGIEVIPQLTLPYNRLFIIVFTIFIILFVYFTFFRTNFGLKLRAVMQNRSMSASLGIPTRRVDALAFFMGTGIAGMAGWAITLIGNVVPNMGQTYIVDSFLVVVTGGVGKLVGTIFSGLGIGMITKFLEPVFNTVYSKVLILVIIILFLQYKPTGLFPSKGR